MATPLNFEEFKKLKQQGYSTEVIASGGYNAQEKTQQPGFVQSMAQSFVSPLAKAAATGASSIKGAFNLGQAGLAHLQGNEQEQKRQLAQANTPVNLDLGYLGKYGPIESTKEAIGTGLEIGSTAIPFTKAGTTVLKGANVFKQAGKIGALGGAFGASRGLQEEGATPQSIFGRTLTGAATGAVLGGGTALIGGALKYLGSRIPKFLAMISGEDTNTVKYALNNPKIADQGIKAGDAALRKAVQKGSAQSIKVRTNFIKSHKLAFDKIAGKSKSATIDKNKIIKEFKNILSEDYRVGVSKGVLDFKISPVRARPGEISKIETAYDIMKNWKDWSLSGTNELKRTVGELVKFAKEEGGSSKSPVLGRTYYLLNEQIKKTLPITSRKAYIELNSKFGKYIDLYDDMVKAFNSGDPFSKLAGVLGKNKDSLTQIIKFYEQKTGQKILPIVAGRKLAEERMAAFGFINPREWVDILISPETQAQLITGYGKYQTGAGKLIEKMSPRILQGINTLKQAGRVSVLKDVPRALDE